METVNNNSGDKRNSRPRVPSLREAMMGRPKVKVLPENFFERVLDLELILKRNFTMNSLQELVNIYSDAIEYYESLEDNRFRDYQNRLNLLLSQPEILKNMNDQFIKKASPETNNLNNDKKAKKDVKSYYNILLI